MKMIQIQDLFEVKGGSNITASQLSAEPFANSIPVVGASGALKKTVGGYLDKDNVSNKVFPQNTIYVSTTGALCCTAFLAPCEFAGNIDMVALIEKRPLTIKQKLYYCLCINANKYRFSYGRKPKGARFSTLEIPAPEEIPSWVETIELPQQYTNKAKSDEKVELPPTSKWKEFKYTDLFNLEKVRGPKVSEIKNTTGSTAYISATAENNGIKCFCDVKPEHEGKRITCGHLGDCFYQETPFVGSNVVVMNPKFLINRQIGLFMVTILNQNKFLFSYAGGGVAGLSKLSKMSLSLPVTSEGQPDYDLMERYINSLPYSDCL